MSGGQYTISGAVSCTPFSRTSWTTPTTSCHGIFENSRRRFPIAADGVPHISRARFSETITTGLESVDFTPSHFASCNQSCPGRPQQTGRDILVQPQRRDDVVRIDLVLGKDLIPSRVESFHGHLADEPGGLHALNRGELVEDRVLCSRHSLRFRDQRIRNGNSHRLQVLRARQIPDRLFATPANVRIIKPALIKSTSAIATCPTTSKFRARCCSRLTLIVRPALCRAEPLRGPRIFQRRNQSKQQARQHRENKSECPAFAHLSIFHSSEAASMGPPPPESARQHTPEPTPTDPPITPSITLSTSSPRTIRVLPAPSAVRTANSCCRASTLTSNKFVTFAQAISSTTPIVPITTHSNSPTLPITSCFSGANHRRDFPRLVNMRIDPGPLDQESIQIGSIRVRSALASAIVAPGLSRAIRGIRIPQESPCPGRMPAATANSKS